MFPGKKIIQTSLENINYGTLRNLRPLGLIRQLARCSDSTCLQVLSNRVAWWIYLEQGKIIYATHSIEPGDRLQRHLRRLSLQFPGISTEILTQLQFMLAEQSQKRQEEHPDYQGICWLMEQQYLSIEAAALLIQEMVKEVMESFLLISQGTYELTNQLHLTPRICRLNTDKIITICQERLQFWQLMETKILSPYQRPYLVNTQQINPTSLIDGLELSDWMKGLSIRHLAAIANQDELLLASKIYPYVTSGAIVLHEPDPPSDRLPTISTHKSASNSVFITPKSEPASPLVIPESKNEAQPSITTDSDQVYPLDLDRQKIYTIVAVERDPAILQQISQILVNPMFAVITINQPVQDPLMIIRYNPDLILLDLHMTAMDGYELCRLIRHHPMFKGTPVVMMTRSHGIIDRIKIGMVGASGFFTKPFNEVELLKMVFTHLN